MTCVFYFPDNQRKYYLELDKIYSKSFCLFLAMKKRRMHEMIVSRMHALRMHTANHAHQTVPSPRSGEIINSLKIISPLRGFRLLCIASVRKLRCACIRLCIFRHCVAIS